MPLDTTAVDIEADLEILEAIDAHIDRLVGGLLTSGAIQKTIRHWLVGHAEPPEDAHEQNCLVAMAADLELFTPSMSGRTMLDRYLNSQTPEEKRNQRRAFQALGAAQFRLVRIVAREGAEEVRLKDLVTGESLRLLDVRLSPLAAGEVTAMRLCPLESGLHVSISPLFAMDDTLLEGAMTFVRPGRPLGHGHRCAASLYRNVARRGVQPIPERDLELDLDADGLLNYLRQKENLTPVNELALRWISGAEAEGDLVEEARHMTSVDNLVDALGCFGQMPANAPQDLRAVYERIAALQVETIAQRARAGISSARTALDLVAHDIDGHIARGDMETGSRELFNRLRRQWASLEKAKPEANPSAAAADIDRVIERIKALRTRTVDHGCTEAEAMAAAAKVSELLDRHDLTLDEVSVRRSACEGISIATGRKRRAPVDSCMPTIAAFCDCRTWLEEDDQGMWRYMFFGLKADVEAARFLNDLIEVTFDSESNTFRHGAVYLKLSGGDRRMALNSFQVGLASGISGKLIALKTVRQSAGQKSTGFDLVAVKRDVVDEEIGRLGLNFTTRQARSRRYVNGDAFNAGQAAGAMFEPNTALVD